MADEEHLTRLQQGVQEWNQWREANRNVRPDFSKANLCGVNLSQANLFKANFSEANLSRVNLFRAHLSAADLSKANLSEANLSGARLFKAKLSAADLSKANLSKATFSATDLSGADMSQADLYGATLTWANLSGANLAKANLEAAILLETNFEGANLTGCAVYGIAAWNVNLVETQQSDLVITRFDEPEITVDNLEVTQFIYLLLHNENIRKVIDTITSKTVLILGRFTPERKVVLNAMREELRRRNYLPIVFDFEKPASRDLMETISTLAHMVRFIIADLTEAKSIPQELQRIVPDLPSVPVQPVLLASAEEYSMFEHFKRYPWVLETYRYEGLEEVIASLTEKVITPAELKANELLGPMKR